MVTVHGVFTPTRLRHLGDFQGTMSDAFEGLLGNVYDVSVDDIGIWTRNWQKLMQRLRMVLDRLKARSIYAAAHKVRLFRRELRLRGNIYSGIIASHDPERVQGLATMHRAETVGEPIQFLKAVN